MTNQERAEETIQELTGPGELGKNAAQAIAQALADAGLLMPELPTDATGMWASGEWPAGFNYPVGLGEWPAHAYAYAPGEIGISAPKTMSTDEAEALALAILAAVKSDRKHNKETINE